MNKIFWATDIHLDHLTPAQRISFYQDIAAKKPEVLILCGDISVAPQLTDHLLELSKAIPAHIYFVLGNHDYYWSSFAEVHERIADTVRQRPNLTWLTQTEIVELDRFTAILGHEGWCDARLGDYETTQVILSDFLLIRDLSGLTQEQMRPFYETQHLDPAPMIRLWKKFGYSREKRLQVLRDLGDRTADYIYRVLPRALKKYSNLLWTMHTPPFKEASWYDGEISSDDWLPYFCCEAAGRAMQNLMRQHPDRNLLVLCGHTHGWGKVDILPNLKVITGQATYGQPTLQPPLEW